MCITMEALAGNMCITMEALVYFALYDDLQFLANNLITTYLQFILTCECSGKSTFAVHYSVYNHILPVRGSKWFLVTLS